jgi:N utilization substance protein A
VKLAPLLDWAEPERVCRGARLKYLIDARLDKAFDKSALRIRYHTGISSSPPGGLIFLKNFMFDLKVIHSVFDQLEEERGIPREKIIEAIEAALATAYRKDYGKKGQIIRAKFDFNTGATEFFQVKIVVDESQIVRPNEDGTLPEMTDEEAEEKIVFNPEHHILLTDAQRIKKDAQIDEEVVFPLEMKDDYGRIASQTAKQVIIQKIREAEKVSVLGEYGKREGEIVSGTVQRIERGNIFVDMGRASGILPYEEQIPGERYRQGERIRAYLYRVEETPRGIFLRLSRSHPKFLVKLFEAEAPEVANGVVEAKAVAREAGSRTKIAVTSNDPHIDPVGSLVGQRGVRVSTVMSELGVKKSTLLNGHLTSKPSLKALFLQLKSSLLILMKRKRRLKSRLPKISSPWLSAKVVKMSVLQPNSPAGASIFSLSKATTSPWLKVKQNAQGKRTNSSR